MRRREYLAVIGAGGMAAVAGCSGGGSDGDSGDQQNGQQPDDGGDSAGNGGGDGSGSGSETETEATPERPSAGPPYDGAPTFGYDAGHSGAAPDERGLAETPSEAWRVQVGPDDGNNYAASPWPVVVGNTVYAGTTMGTLSRGENRLYALDAETGDERWGYNDRRPMGVPTVADGTVVTAMGGNVVALDAETGEERWTFTPEGANVVFHESPPIAMDGQVYAVGENGSDRVYALDVESGERRWAMEYDYVGGVAAADGTLFYTAAAGDADAVLRGASPDGTEVWEGPTATGVPTVAGGTVYASSAGGEELVAADAETGEEQWSVSTPPEPTSGVAIANAVAVADGSVYLHSSSAREATSHLVALDDAGEERWSRELRQATSTPSPEELTPAVVEGTVYVIRGTGVGAFTIDGDELWQMDDGAGTGPPVVVDGRLFRKFEADMVQALDP